MTTFPCAQRWFQVIRLLPWIAWWLPVAAMAATDDGPAVVLTEQAGKVVLSNGRITATISQAASTITSIRFGDHEMVSASRPVYYSMGGGSSYRQPSHAEFRIVKQSPEIADVAFLQRWKPGNPQAVDIEIPYGLERGGSGGSSLWKTFHHGGLFGQLGRRMAHGLGHAETQ